LGFSEFEVFLVTGVGPAILTPAGGGGSNTPVPPPIGLTL
jgi:hypothetical protein